MAELQCSWILASSHLDFDMVGAEYLHHLPTKHNLHFVSKFSIRIDNQHISFGIRKQWIERRVLAL